MHYCIKSCIHFQEQEANNCGVEEEQQGNECATLKPCLTVQSGFVWDVPDTPDTQMVDESSESEDEDTHKVNMDLSFEEEINKIWIC